MSFKVIQPNLSESFDMDNSVTSHNLRGFLYHNVVGSSVDYRTPLWGEAPRSEILAQWDSIFNAWSAGADLSIFESLVQFEHEMRGKVGPYSIMAPLSDRMEGILEYFTLGVEDPTKKWTTYMGWFDNPSDPYLDIGVERVLCEFHQIRGSIRLRSRRNVILNMKLNTNSGSPYFTKRKRVIEKTLAGRTDSYNLVAVLGWRGQEGGPNPEDVKQRAVFMMPFNVNIEELRFYQPFIEAVQRHELIPAYVSSDCVERRVTRLFDTKNPNDMIVATDFTKFDHHFNHGMQSVARYIISELITRCVESKDWLIRVFPFKFEIPLLLSKDAMVVGNHGMGSGSGGTNADETLAHRALQHGVAARQGVHLNPNSMCLGDDGILSYPGITVEDVIKFYEQAGQEMNPEKQYAATDNTVFLRRWYHTKFRSNGICRGVYSTYRALGRLMGQERFYDPKVWGPEMVVLRSLSILENCKEHPLFYKLVDFVVKGDKYRLGLDIPGFFDKIDAKYAEAKAKLPSFGSYTQDIQNDIGIKSWSVVKYLSAMKR